MFIYLFVLLDNFLFGLDRMYSVLLFDIRFSRSSVLERCIIEFVHELQSWVFVNSQVILGFSSTDCLPHGFDFDF